MLGQPERSCNDSCDISGAPHVTTHLTSIGKKFFASQRPRLKLTSFTRWYLLWYLSTLLFATSTMASPSVVPKAKSGALPENINNAGARLAQRVELALGKALHKEPKQIDPTKFLVSPTIGMEHLRMCSTSTRRSSSRSSIRGSTTRVPLWGSATR